MTHKNNHARSKRKRKALRLKNKMSHILSKRIAKMEKSRRPNGQTLILRNSNYGAKDFAIPVEQLYPNGGGGFLFDHNKPLRLNQRQKRKIWRMSPHTRRKAA